MPRQSKPTIQPSLHTKISTLAKINPVNTLIIVLIILAILLYTVAFLKHSVKEPVIETQSVVNTVPTNQLEIQIEKQNVLINKLEADNVTLQNNIKLLEKRIQAHTDFMKRLCEYVVVITVDKKIIPRQCLPEYKWGKEENGN